MITPVELKATVEHLRHQRDAMVREMNELSRKVEQFNQAIEQLGGVARLDTVWVVPPEAEAGMYADLGIREAAKRWLLEQGNTPQSTSQLEEVLRRRGITTKSKKFSATIYATLVEAPEFERTKDRKWVLRQRSGA